MCLNSSILGRLLSLLNFFVLRKLLGFCYCKVSWKTAAKVRWVPRSLYWYQWEDTGLFIVLMTSSKFDKSFTSAVSNFVYNLIAKDLSDHLNSDTSFTLPSLKFVSLFLFRVSLRLGTLMSLSSAEMQFQIYLFINVLSAELDLFSTSANNISSLKSQMLFCMMMLIRLRVF